MQTIAVHFKRTFNQNWGDKRKGKDQNWNQSLPGRPNKHEQLHVSTIFTKKQGDLPVDITWTGYTTREFKTILSTRSSYHSSWNKWIITRPKITEFIQWNRLHTKPGICNFSLTKWTGHDAQKFGIRRHTTTKYRRGDQCQRRRQCLDNFRQYMNYGKLWERGYIILP